jgi:hypothetical protein
MQFIVAHGLALRRLFDIDWLADDFRDISSPGFERFKRRFTSSTLLLADRKPAMPMPGLTMASATLTSPTADRDLPARAGRR